MVESSWLTLYLKYFIESTELTLLAVKGQDSSTGGGARGEEEIPESLAEDNLCFLVII